MSESRASNWDPIAEVLSWSDEDEPKTKGSQNGHYARQDESQNVDWLDAFIARNGLTVKRREAQNGGLKLILAECPFNPEHNGSSAALFVSADGKYGFRCQHNSCTGKTWHDVRQKLEPKHKTPTQTQSSDRTPRVMTFAQLTELKVEPVVPLIETVLPTRGVCLMVGNSKSGKTVLGTQLAVAVASGRPLFGFYRVLEPGPAMFIQQDDAAGVESIKQMVSRAPDAKDPIPLFAVDHVPFSLGPEFSAWLESEIVRNRLRLVVIDSYTAMRGSRSTGSDVVKSEQSDLAPLDEIGKRTGTTIVVIHHASKGSASLDWADQAGGTYAMTSVGEGQIHVSRFPALASNAPERLVRIRGRRIGGDELVIRFQKETLSYEYVLAGCAASAYPAFLKIKELFGGENPQTFSPKELSHESGQAIATSHRNIDILLQGGLLTRIARGQYRLSIAARGSL